MFTPSTLAITTGMRQAEMFGMEWDAVDLKQGKLHVLSSQQAEVTEAMRRLFG